MAEADRLAPPEGTDVNHPARVLVVFGTRPEAIKMAPVVSALRALPRSFDTIVAVTAQHRGMLDQVLDTFSIEPDFDLDIMRHGQTLTDLSVRSLSALSPLVEHVRPRAVLVQGDTTTTCMSALAAFYAHTPVGHVEAGLRTYDLEQPHPEEGNRRLTTQLSRWHFAPTAMAKDNLLREGVDARHIHVTGNTVVDALLLAAQKSWTPPPGPIADAIAGGRRIVLVTAHRRENWGDPFRRICAAVAQIATSHPDVHILFATHGNPAVADVAVSTLSHRDHIDLIAPQDYLTFVNLIRAATLILTDSGGVQEEAPTFGRPTLVLREVTERPEAVAAGVVRLVGTNTEAIVKAATGLLANPGEYAMMAHATNPFGDGTAAQGIAKVLSAELQGD
jgi:UDP-N-acetylglucosamine 2-epimerase (non-hydrolysing)